MTATGTLKFAPGYFLGGARMSWTTHGVHVSHRIAACDADEVRDHTHADAHFILVTSGPYVSAAIGRPAVDRPVLVYNPPGTTHRDRFERGRGGFFAISLDPAQAAAALAGSDSPDGPQYLTTPAQHALTMRIARCGARQAMGLTLHSLCLELLGSMDRRARPEPAAAPQWLRTALELLHDRYTEDLSIAAIADGVGVHPVHLARTFHRQFRCTPGEFARFRRLQKAAELLTRTAWPLTEVALASGFADQSHLSKCFADSFGLPPGEYRRVAGPSIVPPGMFQNDKTRLAFEGKVNAWAVARGHTRTRT